MTFHMLKGRALATLAAQIDDPLANGVDAGLQRSDGFVAARRNGVRQRRHVGAQIPQRFVERRSRHGRGSWAAICPRDLVELGGDAAAVRRRWSPLRDACRRRSTGPFRRRGSRRIGWPLSLAPDWRSPRCASRASSCRDASAGVSTGAAAGCRSFDHARHRGDVLAQLQRRSDRREAGRRSRAAWRIAAISRVRLAICTSISLRARRSAPTSAPRGFGGQPGDPGRRHRACVGAPRSGRSQRGGPAWSSASGPGLRGAGQGRTGQDLARGRGLRRFGALLAGPGLRAALSVAPAGRWPGAWHRGDRPSRPGGARVRQPSGSIRPGRPLGSARSTKAASRASRLSIAALIGLVAASGGSSLRFGRAWPRSPSRLPPSAARRPSTRRAILANARPPRSTSPRPPERLPSCFRSPCWPGEAFDHASRYGPRPPHCDETAPPKGGPCALRYPARGLRRFGLWARRRRLAGAAVHRFEAIGQRLQRRAVLVVGLIIVGIVAGLLGDHRIQPLPEGHAGPACQFLGCFARIGLDAFDAPGNALLHARSRSWAPIASEVGAAAGRLRSKISIRSGRRPMEGSFCPPW